MDRRVVRMTLVRCFLLLSLCLVIAGQPATVSALGQPDADAPASTDLQPADEDDG
jgi:hypothetical protein